MSSEPATSTRLADMPCLSDLERLDEAGQHHHVVVDVDPEDMRFALSQLCRAHRAAPLSTSSAVFVLRQHAMRKTWMPYLTDHVRAGTYRASDADGNPKLVGVYRRESGFRTRGATHVDQLRDASDVLVMHSADADLGRQLYCTFDLAVDEVLCRTLIDSGAGLNVMTREAVTKRRGVVTPSSVEVTGVHGLPVPTLGCVSFDVQVGAGLVPTQFEVVDALPNGLEAILGQDFMRPLEASIRFGKDATTFECTIAGKLEYVSRKYSEAISKRCPDRAAVNLMSASEAKRLRRLGLLYQLDLKEVQPQVPVTEPPSRKRRRVGWADEYADPAAAHTPRLPRGEVHVIVRDFKVQENMSPLFQTIVDQYKDTVMSGKSPDGTFPREYTASIKLLPGASPRMLKAYRLTPKERKELDEQIKKLLAKGWIRPSSSAWGAPVLFAPKSDGGLRMCVDYRMLNAATKKLNYPMPHIQESLESFKGATLFSTLDLVAGLHQISVNEADRHETASAPQTASLNTTYCRWAWPTPRLSFNAP